MYSWGFLSIHIETACPLIGSKAAQPVCYNYSRQLLFKVVTGKMVETRGSVSWTQLFGKLIKVGHVTDIPTLKQSVWHLCEEDSSPK